MIKLNVGHGVWEDDGSFWGIAIFGRVTTDECGVMQSPIKQNAFSVSVKLEFMFASRLTRLFL